MEPDFKAFASNHLWNAIKALTTSIFRKDQRQAFRDLALCKKDHWRKMERYTGRSLEDIWKDVKEGLNRMQWSAVGKWIVNKLWDGLKNPSWGSIAGWKPQGCADFVGGVWDGIVEGARVFRVPKDAEDDEAGWRHYLGLWYPIHRYPVMLPVDSLNLVRCSEPVGTVSRNALKLGRSSLLCQQPADHPGHYLQGSPEQPFLQVRL